MKLIIHKSKNGVYFNIPLNKEEEFKEDEYYILICEYLGCKIRLIRDFTKPYRMNLFGAMKKIYRVNIPPIFAEKYGIAPNNPINLLKVIEK